MAEKVTRRNHDLESSTRVENSLEGATKFVALVGNRVRQARKQKKLARRELSERSGVSMRYLAQLESGQGNISIALLYRIANALDQKVEWLVTEVSNENTTALRIALIGLRGAGKSTLGPRLANSLNIPFVELNSEIERQAGMAVNELMALYGDEGYRELEQQAVKRIAEKHETVVLAVAGGIVSEQTTYAYLLDHYTTVWLKASPEEHMQRVRAQGDERPMAGNPKAMEQLEFILKSREALYAKATTVVDTSQASLKESEAALIQTIRQLNQPPG